MDLLVRATFKVVPFQLAMPSIFWFVFSGWSSLSVSRLVVFHRDPKSNGETKPCYSWVSRDVISAAQISVRQIGVPRGVKFM